MKWFRKKKGNRESQPEATSGTSSFRARVDEFWDWWRENSSRIYAEVDSDGGAALQPEISATVDQLFPGGMAWVFGPGENREGHSFTVSPEGNATRRILVDYWHSQAPDLPGWTFYSSRQPSVDFGTFELTFEGVATSTDSIWITPEVDIEREAIDIVAWSPAFEQLEENKAGSLLFILLDEALGEEGTSRCIGAIDMGDGKLADSIPLTELPEYVTGVFKENGWDRNQQVGTVYQLKEPLGDFPRGDIFVGSTQDMGIVGDFFDASGPIAPPIEGVGVEWVFLQFPGAIFPEGEEVTARGEIEDALEDEFGKQNAGVVFGGAMGRDAVYIDLVLFDPGRARKVIDSVMQKRDLGGQFQLLPFTR